MSASSHLPTTRAYDRAPRPGSGIAHWIAGWIADIGATLIEWVCGMGSLAIFSLATFRWLFGRLPRKETVLANFYQIGVRSLPVMVVTGTFIGMVLAVQSYDQFHKMGLESSFGAMINWSLVRELGPVLAATMLAGRVGSAMAAELGTMRVTEQIDALASMGANPIHYLVVPRFLACLLLIPALTIWADIMGIIGGGVYSVYLLDIDFHHYLIHAQQYVKGFDVGAGAFKSLFFRGRHRPDQLLPRFSLRFRRGRRRPRRHDGLRLLLHGHPDA